MHDTFTPAEAGRLARDLASDRALRCPRCGLPLDHRRIPPRNDVSYVRRRTWVGCPVCHASTVLDRDEVR